MRQLFDAELIMNYIVSPAEKLSGCIAVPGSKSHTIRAVVAALLGNDKCEIHAPLLSEDTISARRAAEILGAKVKSDDANCWEITG